MTENEQPLAKAPVFPKKTSSADPLQPINPSEREAIKKLFGTHVLYRLCREVRSYCRPLFPGIITSVEQLLVDVVKGVDELLACNCDDPRALCDDLCNDWLDIYRQRDTVKSDIQGSHAKEGMLFLLWVTCLRAVPDERYSRHLAEMVSDSIYKHWTSAPCRQMKRQVEAVMHAFDEELGQWMAEYAPSSESLLSLLEKNPDGNLPADTEEPLPLPDELNTPRAQTSFRRAIDRGWMVLHQGRWEWKGVHAKGCLSQLAYFCGKVYEVDYSALLPNRGKRMPEQALSGLFGVKRLDHLLKQVYEAKHEQLWRADIDRLFG